MRPALVLAVLAGLVLPACSEVEPAAEGGYQPAQLAHDGGASFPRVTFTGEGAARTGLRTATVARSAGHAVVPYAALIYDGQGDSFVYTSPRPLTFVRAPVAVARVDGDRVLLSEGPPAGTVVVTVGASEVYGTELEIAGGH